MIWIEWRALRNSTVAAVAAAGLLATLAASAQGPSAPRATQPDIGTRSKPC